MIQHSYESIMKAMANIPIFKIWVWPDPIWPWKTYVMLTEVSENDGIPVDPKLG